MDGWSPSRRTVLLASGAALGTAALGGCLGGNRNDGTAPADVVPAGAQYVCHADVAALLADDRLRTRFDAILASIAEHTGTDLATVDAALAQFDSAVGLDVRDLDRLTVFGGYEPGAPVGIRLDADWSEAAISDAAGAAPDAEPESYNGRPIYRTGPSTVLAVLGEGAYVYGTRAGVEAAVDVAAGDADPVAGRVREALAAATAGAVRFGFAVPADLGQGGRGSGPVDSTAFDAVTHGYGGYAAKGEERLASITLEAESAEAAERVLEQLRTARDLARQQLDTADMADLAGDVDAMLAALDLDAVGSSVTVTLDEGENIALLLGAVVATFVVGFGDQPQPRAPRAAFSFDYDDSAGRLSITHTGGDHLGAAALAVRGTGLPNGSWLELGGSTSAEVGGRPAIAAGDALTVDADADYDTQLVWTDPDGGASAVLASHRGPAG